MTVLQTSQLPVDEVRLPAAVPLIPFRIAVAGCGPKGMYCLERLAFELSRSSQQSEVQITIFEPASFPGAGVVYDPRQPHYLRMNFASRFINVWPEAIRQRNPDAYPTLLEWLEHNHPQYADPHGFVSRALVGEYLAASYQKTLQLFPDFVNVTQVKQKVTEIQKAETCWSLKTAESEFTFDEVLLTVGHEGWRPTPFSHPSSKQIIEKAYPAEQMLSESRIPSGSTVAIRGFALTFIDACLTLTEGRGGKFFRDNQDWIYLPSGDEVQTIVPFSRTGHPMLAKPDSRYFKSHSGLEQIWEQGRQHLLNLKQPETGLDFQNAIWPVILKTAEEALLSQVPDHPIGSSAPQIELQIWFQDWSNRSFSPEEAFQCLQQSYRVAMGLEVPDEAWAIGETFRQLYPALVRKISFGGLAFTSWSDFQRTAEEMERLAFGPPAENIGRLIALIDAGIVDLDYLQADFVAHENKPMLETAGKQMVADRLINAIIPNKDQFAKDSLLEQLLSSGRIRRMLGAGGIAVDGAGRPILPEEQNTEGLAIIGRPTEGCVLGNDTLSRQLHSCQDRWAQSVCEQIARRKEK